ncbi:energy-coupling factor transporter transmembrane protein EcfT [Erysipelothrix urinaevulpis]|uniref:energy-coupling factor transporter transmembrane component T family protein n=1 Tax=Erysipelothrix urinaevulpis TaxID=2683717 RepID=UPI0013572CBC|nr:energy-coupling factor transporter transmembrane component T [Erysipelothrix urinaevulpis]
MNNITLGQYVPLDSKIHRIDPRMKIVAMIILMVGVMIVPNFYGYAFLFTVLTIVILISKLTISYVIKAMKPMLMMMIILFVLNMFLIKTGKLLIDFWFIKIYSDALSQTLFIVFRLMLMVMVTTLLTATTAPLDLTLGIEDLLKPFQKIGVPAHEIAMIISIALRFIPTLIEDTQRIMNAQASRGVDLQEGSFREKISGVISMIVPLFISSYHRAEDLADAMEARGYFPGKERTRYKQLKIRFTDWLVLAITIVIVVGVQATGRF